MLAHCHAGCSQEDVLSALGFGCAEHKAGSSSIKHQDAEAASSPVIQVKSAGNDKKLWRTLEEAQAAFSKLESVRTDKEAQRYLLIHYGLERTVLPDSWRPFDHPDPKLGPGVIYQGESPDGSPVFKYKSFARNDKRKRECRFLFGAGGVLAFERPSAPLVLVGGEEKALAAYCSGYSAVALLTGEKALCGAIIKRIIAMNPPRIVLANDNDEAGARGNKSIGLALAGASFPASKIFVIHWSDDAPSGFDLNDVLIGGGPNALREKIDEARPYAETAIPATITAAALDRKEYPEQRQIIEKIRPEGQTVLGSRPKKGKSWLELGFAVAVASGTRALGAFETTAGDVLYLALEDSERRIKSRLQMLLGEEPKPERLHFATKWPRLDAGGLDALRLWLEQHPDAAMIIIDTFTRVRPPKPPGADPYQADSEATAALQRLALEFHVAIVLVMHQRKSAADDVFDTISGTMGMTASADVVSVLTRENSGEGRLNLTGRDIEERTLALSFEGGTWQYLGEADEDEEPAPLDDAQAFLREILKDGPVESSEIFSQGKKVQISKNKLYGAKDALGIKPKKDGRTGKWAWALPRNELLNARDMGKLAKLGKLGKFGKLGNFGEDREDGEVSEEDDEYYESNFSNSPNLPNFPKIPNFPDCEDVPEVEQEVRL